MTLNKLIFSILRTKGLVAFAIGLFLFAGEAKANMAINVFAGDDFSLCEGDLLILSNLQATISGDVSDGIWFTLGDGVFAGTNSNSVVFSSATTYTPGAGDIASGSFNLILVSDDPDGNGPQTEVSDEVNINFQGAPSMACNQNLNVSLGAQCQQPLDVFMLLANPQMPFDRYSIIAYDEAGDEIVDNILNHSHIGQNINFNVSHDCGSNSCWGMLSVADNAAPQIFCADVTIDCRSEGIATEIGLPIPSYTSIDTIAADSFAVEGWDDCTTVLLTHTDNIVKLNCNSAFDKIIARNWTVTDEAGNASTCTQSLYVERIGLDSIILPRNYNDIDLPSLSCDSIYPLHENGNPSPSFTGAPNVFNCGNMEARFDDVNYEVCGGGTSIVRSWFIIDWCTTQDFEFNQIIKIKDKTPPIFTCPASITVDSDSYDCNSEPFMLMDVDSIVDCSSFTVEAELRNTVDNQLYNSSDLTFDDIPLGTYLATYVVSDECGNSSSCTSSVTINDTSVPFAICDGFTTVSITNNGEGRLNALSLDDSSLDNCGIASMAVAKMTDQCDPANLDFREYVSFCCEEVGQQIMVAFKVTDFAGNSNTCMATVEVEDKIAPEITCPSDLTISCDFLFDPNDLSEFGGLGTDENNLGDIIIFDAYNNGVAGQNGWYQDNCEASVSDTSFLNLDCGGLGTIQRIFTVTDLQGLQSTCTQEITITNLDPFEGNDINWPSNVIQVACGGLDINPDVTGEPTYNNESCAMVEATHEDQILFVSDTACAKVLRTWLVIDWCQYDQFTGEGSWSYVQEIQLENKIAPTISNCDDLELCSYADNCGPASFSYFIEATDDCTAVLDMMYEWSIDSNDDNIPDYFGSGREIELNLPLGEHEVKIEVEDRCGNLSSCKFNVIVSDCKKPTPYCVSSITTVVMPTTGSIEIAAAQFDNGSFDNCGDIAYISFTADIKDSIRLLTCTDLIDGLNTEIELELWVTDEAGNQDYCVVHVILQDPNDACPNAAGFAISGKIESFNAKTLDSIIVHYESSNGISGEVMAIDGSYMIEGLRPGDYTISPSKTILADDGVSTLDLVLTQRHIIRAAPFTSPFKLLAGDVTNNKSLSGSDVVMMRKLILGKIDKMNGEPMRFVPAAHEFLDPDFPYEAPGTIQIMDLKTDLENQDFIIIKRGDVDGNLFSFDANQNLENRSASAYFDYKVDESGILTFYATEDMTLDGFQFSFYCDEELDLIDDGIISIQESMIHQKDGNVLISYSNTTAKIIREGERLFSLNGDLQSKLELSKDLEAEIYENSQSRTLSIKAFSSKGLFTCLVKSNPFHIAPEVVVTATEDQEITMQVFDVSGKVLHQERNDFIAGINHLNINANWFSIPGVYMLHLESNQGYQETIRLIKVK